MINAIKKRTSEFFYPVADACTQKIKNITSKVASTFLSCKNAYSTMTTKNFKQQASLVRQVSKQKDIQKQQLKHEIAAAICFIVGPLMIIGGLYAGGLLSLKVSITVYLIFELIIISTYFGSKYRIDIGSDWIPFFLLMSVLDRHNHCL
jgi:hypothetical protein